MFLTKFAYPNPPKLLLSVPLEAEITKIRLYKKQGDWSQAANMGSLRFTLKIKILNAPSHYDPFREFQMMSVLKHMTSVVMSKIGFLQEQD